MASGSSGRSGSGSKGGFDFGTDDVLCSYDDFGNQESSNGKPSDSVHGTNSTKDFRESRMGRPAAFLPVYNQSEESSQQELISTVERTMKKYADNLLRFLEGISSRLSQLELYCYNLEKSVGEMRSDLLRENKEADSKLSSLEKHLQEVHRSIQILRDKQELADTQKELAKLQVVHKESSQNKEEVITPSASDLKKLDTPPEVQKQQLALALPQQLNPPSQISSQNVLAQTQPSYYPQQSQLPTPPLQTQHPQDPRYLPAESPYQRSQLPISQPAPPALQSHAGQLQPQPAPAFSPYQQQWSQQYPQQVQQQQQQQQPHQPSPQAQMPPQTTPSYPPYPPTQPVNPISSLSGLPRPGGGRPEAVYYGYGGTNRANVPQQPPQHNMQRPQQPPTQQTSYGDGTYSNQAPRQGYMVYDAEGGRVPSHFPQGVYPPPPPGSSLQNQPPVRHPSPSQMMRNNPYNELVEKAVSMGYGRDFVLSVIHNMEESGQPMDFNSLLDRLNMHSSGGSQRGAWMP